MPAFFPFALAAAFAAIWTGVSYLLSWASGWPALARRFPAASEPPGERLIWSSAQLSGVSFRNCLNMTLSPEGLYMVPSRLFGLFMPAMIIPWRDVRFEGLKSFFFYKLSYFRLGGADGPLLCVFGRAGERLRPFLSETDRKDYDSGRKFAGSLFDRRIAMIAAGAALIGLGAALFAASARR